MILVIAAHVINIIVAGAVSFLILTKHHSMDAVYQKDTHARRILACVYASIAEMESPITSSELQI